MKFGNRVSVVFKSDYADLKKGESTVVSRSLAFELKKLDVLADSDEHKKAPKAKRATTDKEEITD